MDFSSRSAKREVAKRVLTALVLFAKTCLLGLKLNGEKGKIFNSELNKAAFVNT
jgi:hypothetical protein